MSTNLKRIRYYIIVAYVYFHNYCFVYEKNTHKYKNNVQNQTILLLYTHICYSLHSIYN